MALELGWQCMGRGNSVCAQQAYALWKEKLSLKFFCGHPLIKTSSQMKEDAFDICLILSNMMCDSF